MFYEVLLAFGLFAFPFGRFIVIAMRAGGIAILLQQGFGALEIFGLFMAASSLSSGLCVAFFEKARAFALRFNVAKRVILFASQQRVKVAYSFGNLGLAVFVSLLNFATSPLYAAAVAALARVPWNFSFAGLVFGNAVSFLALYFLGELFGRSLVSIATAAVIVFLAGFAAFFLLAGKKKDEKLIDFE